MSFTIKEQDITKLEVDVIVNAANTELRQGSGVCGAIFKAAGSENLKIACDKLSPIKTGEAVITPGFSLSAKYIIHTAGPIYSRDKEKAEELLKNCYINSLKLAKENGCKNIAFPLISSGVYGYPKQEAFEVAKKTIESFLKDNDMNVILTIF